MKNLLILSLLTLSLAACNKGQQSQENTGSIDASKIQLASEKDPVCQMSVKDHMTDTATYKGKTYGFCGKACKDAFLKEPEKYSK